MLAVIVMLLFVWFSVMLIPSKTVHYLNKTKTPVAYLADGKAGYVSYLQVFNPNNSVYELYAHSPIYGKHRLSQSMNFTSNTVVMLETDDPLVLVRITVLY